MARLDPLVQFFGDVLPSAGVYIVAVPATTSDGRPYFKHFYGNSRAWVSECAQYLDANRGLNTFFALATFREDGERDDRGRIKRLQANAQAVRAFWLDIDVGESKPGKPEKYATQREAAEAVMQFTAKLGLPQPYIIRSGGGIHVYWPMSEDIEPARWLPTAQLLKAACRVEGLLADPTRTADYASVLRPPGTHHRKAEPKLVRVAVTGVVSRLGDFQQLLLPYAAHVDLPAAEDDLGDVPAHLKGLETPDDLSAGIERRPCSASLAAGKCGILAMVRDARGDVDEPTWYHALGVLAYAEDGASLAHEWSDGHPGYSPEATERKLAQYAKHGRPPTCAKLGEHHQTTCAVCPHQGKVKTPYSLGLHTGELVQMEQLVKKPDGTFHLVKQNVDYPDPFFRKQDGLYVMVQPEDDENAAPVPVKFCDSIFYPVNRLRIDGISCLEFEMELRGGELRRFLMDGGLIGKGKDGVAGELGRQEIVPLPGKAHTMDSYLRRWMTFMKDTREVIVASPHFGWNEDHSFTVGDTIYKPGNVNLRGVLTGLAKSKAPALEPRGDLQTWVRLVDRAYNAPGQEAYQFILACGFAAPLLKLQQHVAGVTVYAHSEGTGVGKTTAQRVALSAWGNWDALMLAEGKTTVNAMWGLMGAYHTLPVVFDELTNMRNDLTSDLVFSVSSGRSKERMRADGELRENNANWCTILLASGNTLLSEKLSMHRANAEAEVARLFEFTLTAAPHLSPNEANEIFPLFTEHYGHAGRVWAKHLVDNREALTEELRVRQNTLNEQLNISQAERHWSALLSAVHVAVAQCRSIGLLQFDEHRLHSWVVDRLAENRRTKSAAAVDPLELFGAMLADLWQGILVTTGEGDVRSGKPASVVEKPRGALVGRAILPQGKNTQPVLMLNDRAVRDWANSKGVSAKEIHFAAARAGWIELQPISYSLGRGTLEYSQVTSYIPCWKVYPEKITGVGFTDAVAQKLGTVEGGKNVATGRD